MSLKIIYRRWSYLLLIASLTAIIVATVSPFKFVVPDGFSIKFIIEEFNFGSGIKDYLQNILLFMPLGISLAAICKRKQLSILSILTICCLVSAATSTAVEVTQLFLPIRTSNWTDVICNSLGGSLGGVFYYWRRSINKFAIGVVKADPKQLSLQSLLIAIAGYCFLIILGIWVLLVNVNLSNWNEDFYLALGNEVTGDRPWNGSIYNLYISDRSLESADIAKAFEQTNSFFQESSSWVTAWDFSQVRSEYRDDSQHLPNLLWQTSSRSLPTQSETSGISVNAKQWLKSEQPANLLTQRLQQTNEFTVFITIATDKLKQRGPARILAFSQGIYAQNLLIGQKNTNLSFRLRTPITGNNATQPEFVIPKVFDSKAVRQIAIAFTDNQLSFYIDRVDNKYSFEFTPATCSAIYFPWQKRSWIINLGQFEISKYQKRFYTIVAIPLVILTFILVYYLLVNKITAKRSNS